MSRKMFGSLLPYSCGSFSTPDLYVGALLTLLRARQCLTNNRDITAVFMHYLQFVHLPLFGRLFLVQYNQKGSRNIMGMLLREMRRSMEVMPISVNSFRPSWNCKLLSIYDQTAYLFQVQLNYSDQRSTTIDIYPNLLPNNLHLAELSSIGRWGKGPTLP